MKVYSPGGRYASIIGTIASMIIFFVILVMLLQLDETNRESLNRLLSFAKENNLNLSLVDESDYNYHLLGKPLSPEQLMQLIKDSRKSGIISMKTAHKIISNNYNAD